MKTIKVIALMCAVLCSLSTVEAKEKNKVETVTYRIDEMHCADCEKKIKDCIRFEKGLKDVDTNLKARTVTLSYDAEKTSPEKLEQRFKKSKYTPVKIKDEPKEEKRNN